jgi:hypothetical protein
MQEGQCISYANSNKRKFSFKTPASTKKIIGIINPSLAIFLNSPLRVKKVS